MTEPRPLDVIDDNFCATCGSQIELLNGAGWMHSQPVACTSPAPKLQRCATCGCLVFAFAATSRLRHHPVRVDGLAVAGSLCPGGLQRGIPPMADPWTQPAQERT